MKASGVRRCNLSISDLLMDSLIKNDSIDLLIPGAADESICGKLSHTNVMTLRCENRNTLWEEHTEREVLCVYKKSLFNLACRFIPL